MIGSWIKQRLRGDQQVWFIIFLLSILSILVVYSATGTLAYKRAGGNTEFYLFKHGVLVLAGLGVMWLAHNINYAYYARISMFAMWLSIPLMLFALAFGTKIGGASRWITIPFIGQTFQPSDLAKLALLTNLASMLAKRQNVRYDIGKLGTLIFWCGLIVFIIALSSFSTAAILGFTCFLMMWIGRVPTRYLFRLLVLVFFLALPAALLLGQRSETVRDRLTAFLKIEKSNKKVRETSNYQIEQAYIAIATGDWTGKKPGNSDQRNYLPEAFSDFIYAIIVEEYGFVGGIGVMLLYLWLLYRGMKSVQSSSRAFGGLLAAGLTLSIVIQAFIHIAINVGLGPVTGQPLPLISMGGTSILFNSVAIGIIISVSRGEYDESGI